MSNRLRYRGCGGCRKKGLELSVVVYVFSSYPCIFSSYAAAGSVGVAFMIFLSVVTAARGGRRVKTERKGDGRRDF